MSDVDDFFGPYEKEFEVRPLEKRHHPECPAKLNDDFWHSKCRCRQLYDADYSDGFGMPQR